MVAVKKLFMSKDPDERAEILEDFAKEVQILSRLKHRCIVQFLDNTSYAYLFAMDLEKLPVKDKITASCQILYVQSL